jgi:hypothetical protein
VTGAVADATVAPWLLSAPDARFEILDNKTYLEIDMSRNTVPQQANTLTRPASQGAEAAKPAEVANLLATVGKLLDEGQARKALETLARSQLQSPWVTNGQGVCHLRLGNAKVAIDAFRGLVLAPTGLNLRRDVPPIFIINYAAALLATGNVAGCQSSLAEVRGQQHPSIDRLQGAIARWQQGLSFWQKLNWWMGGEPDHGVQVDFPLGDLE